MTRYSRALSASGIYHIMLRGNERKEIFIDEDDRKRFIDTLIEKSAEENAVVHAYCLMDNHIHLLLGGISDNLSRLMKRISVSYVYYFNKKYRRVGHLFQGRFKSQCVENDSYLLEAVRYIHNNPVKAAMVKTPMEYPWSSFQQYIGESTPPTLAFGQILDMFADTRPEAIKNFLEFSNKFGEFEFIDEEESTMEELREAAEKQAETEFQHLLESKGICEETLKLKGNTLLRDELILHLRSRYKLSTRQMESVTGINRGVVLKIYQKAQDCQQEPSLLTTQEVSYE